MSEKLAPYRSQSHSLNDFYRQVAGDIDRLYQAYGQLNSDAELIVAAARLQEAAVAAKIRALETRLDQPRLEPDGTWTQRVDATAFAASPGGAVLSRFGMAATQVTATRSCLLVTLPDGQRLLPGALKVEVEPVGGEGITDTSPYWALEGYRPWWRRTEVGPARATYTVHLPLAVLEEPVFNQIRVVTFPLYGVLVKAVEYRRQSAWYSLGPEQDVEGALLLTVPPTEADAVRVMLEQPSPTSLGGEEAYHLGLAQLEVERVTVSDDPAVFTAPVALAGSAPWELTELEVETASCCMARAVVVTGDRELGPESLPVSLTEGKVQLRVALEQEEGCRPLMRGVRLRYRSS